MMLQLRRHRDALLIVVFSAVLHVLYLLATSYKLRGHDVGGHIDYIVYLVRNSYALPPPHGGLEFYHPPLYYWLMAPFYQLGMLLNIEEVQIFFGMQMISVVLSIVSLICAMWVGKMVLQRENRLQFIFYGLLIAAAPSLLLAAARINNDALYNLLSFFSLAVLTLWWKHRSMRLWIIFSVLVGLGLITKSTALLFIPIGWCCLLLLRGMDIRQKVLRILISLLVISAIAGWFHVPRYSDEDAKTALVGNRDILTNFVPNDVAAYTVFNPLQILEYPFNHAFDDTHRRRYFWEYYFRSALFGEFTFEGEYMRPLAQTILVLAIFLTLIAQYGFVRTARSRLYELLPLHLTYAVFVAGIVVFRYVYPYSSAQDFRYTLILLVPLAFFVVQGIHFLPQSLQKFANSMVIAFVGLCSVFITLVFASTFAL